MSFQATLVDGWTVTLCVAGVVSLTVSHRGRLAWQAALRLLTVAFAGC